MIQITPQMRIWVAVEPVDFRKGIDGLASLCRQQLQADPMDGKRHAEHHWLMSGEMR
jgi:transposase